MIARLAALLCLLALAAPASALAQGAFDPIPPAPPEQPTTVASEEGDDDDDGLSSTQQLLIGLSGFVLLFGIGWAIVRDARGAAPADSRGSTSSSSGDEPQRKGSQRPAGVRHRENRAKAKAARQARKKARKR